ncbi:MAG: hypothetical protein KAS30_01505 [Candidatus Diapherotrites archaeon]|nr:hypothetical protein [Candidatus Diapherotrites archaeon]
METDGLQYIRKFSLIVADATGQGLDLEGLKITFNISKSEAQTPNKATIRVYNLNPDTLTKIQNEFTRITLQAGYESNFGVIFDGEIKSTRKGKENGTDTFLDISAGDGDVAYNFAIVNQTLAAGSTQADQIQLAGLSMEQQGVSPGFIAEEDGASLPRGKVMYGQSREYLRKSTKNTDSTWSIQDNKLQVVKNTGFIAGQAVVLNSKSGLIGTPEVTEGGIKARCLLNPTLRIGARVKIAEKDIQEALLPDTDKEAPPNQMPSISKDGVYRILSIDFLGDTRGNDWYADFICVDIDEPTQKAVA